MICTYEGVLAGATLLSFCCRAANSVTRFVAAKALALCGRLVAVGCCDTAWCIVTESGLAIQCSLVSL